jgi:hypothetical protein
MQSTLTRSAELAAHPSVRRPSPLPSETASQRSMSPESLSVADLQYALWIARTTHGGGRRGLVELPASVTATRWLSVVAAHSGAGASTVALAVAEAAARERAFDVHLVEYTPDPSRSGLAAAATTELGVDATGTWRHGERGGVVLHRRARFVHCSRPEPPPTPEAAWPMVLTEPPALLPRLVVVDMSGAAHDSPPRGTAVLVVFRVSVPGTRAAEILLERLDGDDPTRPVIAAGIGPRHWPTEVNASVGARLAWLRERDRVVDVPSDRRIAITGVTADPLPKSTLTAASRLLSLLSPDTSPDRGSGDEDGLPDVTLFGFATQARS